MIYNWLWYNNTIEGLRVCCVANSLSFFLSIYTNKCGPQINKRLCACDATMSGQYCKLLQLKIFLEHFYSSDTTVFARKCARRSFRFRIFFSSVANACARRPSLGYVHVLYYSQHTLHCGRGCGGCIYAHHHAGPYAVLRIKRQSTKRRNHWLPFDLTAVVNLKSCVSSS